MNSWPAGKSRCLRLFEFLLAAKVLDQRGVDQVTAADLLSHGQLAGLDHALDLANVLAQPPRNLARGEKPPVARHRLTVPQCRVRVNHPSWETMKAWGLDAYATYDVRCEV